MAISRREILKLGVSYGSGAIKFGNDQLKYDRELRKLPNNTLLQDFLEELSATEAIMAKLAEEEAQQAMQEAEAAVKEPVANADAGEAVAAADSAAEPSEGDQAINSIEEATEEPEEAPNPLNDAIAKAEDFRELCGELSLSELYMQITSIISTMRQAALPAVSDLAKLKEDYGKLVYYLQHC